ncbi:MAG TPA: DnaJ C-terminal domain-containing protein [Patescibacteria group bacterium]|nr:DnaJ C-terminal domain-containing protein [Patescibacteria group bacterium]
MAEKREYYDILGVQKSATADEIKSAYRRLARKHHPDVDKSPDAHQKFKKINEAYEVLSNPQKRETYDQFGHAAFSQGGNAASGNPFQGYQRQGQYGPFSYYSTSGDIPFDLGFDAGGFTDPFRIFEEFFGTASPFGSRARSRPAYKVTVPFDIAAKGGERTLSLDGERKTVRIPAGVDTGTRMRFGNFDLVFEVEPHPELRRDGDDLYATKRISFVKATLGGTEEVQTIDGSITVRIHPGTHSGTLIRLRGKGMPSLQGRGRGDQYIQVQIHVPNRLSKEAKKLFSQLEKELDVS